MAVVAIAPQMIPRAVRGLSLSDMYAVDTSLSGIACCPIPGSFCTNEADPTCHNPNPGLLSHIYSLNASADATIVVGLQICSLRPL